MKKHKRTLAITDIHGHFDEFMEVLEKAKFKPKKDRLITLGDYVDRGPDSGKVIQFLMELKKKYNNTINLMGNHDQSWIEWLKFGKDNLYTLMSPETKKSLIEVFVTPSNCVEFFDSLLPYYKEGSDVFVHAGFTSHRGIGFEPFESNYWWDRTLWESAMLIGDNEYPKRFKNHGRIFIGHTATVNYEDENKNEITKPMFRANVINLDTGCCFGGKLSLMDIKTLEIWQSS